MKNTKIEPLLGTLLILGSYFLASESYYIAKDSVASTKEVSFVHGIIVFFGLVLTIIGLNMFANNTNKE